MRRTDGGASAAEVQLQRGLKCRRSCPKVHRAVQTWQQVDDGMPGVEGSGLD